VKLPLAAGARDCLVTIEQLTPGTGASGFPTETWSPLAQIWMGRMPVWASEQQQGAQLSARADQRWVLPWRADMDPDTVAVPKVRRLVYQGRVLDIVAATAIGRQLGIELKTIAKVDA
jgi:hypothetical protein